MTSYFLISGQLFTSPIIITKSPTEKLSIKDINEKSTTNSGIFLRWLSFISLVILSVNLTLQSVFATLSIAVPDFEESISSLCTIFLFLAPIKPCSATPWLFFVNKILRFFVFIWRDEDPCCGFSCSCCREEVELTMSILVLYTPSLKRFSSTPLFLDIFGVCVLFITSPKINHWVRGSICKTIPVMRKLFLAIIPAVFSGVDMRWKTFVSSVIVNISAEG